MSKNRQTIYIFSFLLLSFCGYLFFGLQQLGNFETTDEHYWTGDPAPGRITRYWQAVSQKDWSNTRINDKPGVSLAYVSGANLIFREADFYKNLFSDFDFYRVSNVEENIRNNYYFRLPLFLFNGLWMFLLFWLVKKLTDNNWIALWSAILVLLSPILLGISRIVNPDSLLWIFSTTSILSFLIFLKTEEKKYAVLCSFALGWALLTKYAATLLYPFFFFSIASSLLFHYETWKDVIHKKVIKYFLGYWAIVAGAMLIFSFLMPAVFFVPDYFLYGAIGFWGMKQAFFLIFLFTVFALADAYRFKSRYLKKLISWFLWTRKIVSSMMFFIFAGLFFIVLINWSDLAILGGKIKTIPFDTERGVEFRTSKYIHQIILELLPLIYSLTPITLLALLLLWIKQTFTSFKNNHYVFILTSFFVLFYASVLSIRLLANVRYAIMLFPLAIILSSIGLYELFALKYLNRINKYAITLGLIVFSFFSLYGIKPYYFNYTNMLLPQKYLINDAWGILGYEAAQYLNSLPNAQNLVVWSDNNGLCPFFKGKCIKGKKDWKKQAKDESINVDYFVRTRRGSVMYRDVWRKIEPTIDYVPIWQSFISGRPNNYVKIYRSYDLRDEDVF